MYVVYTWASGSASIDDGYILLADMINWIRTTNRVSMPINNNIDDAVDYTENPGSMWDNGNVSDEGLHLDDAGDSLDNEDSFGVGTNQATDSDDSDYMKTVNDEFGSLVTTIAKLNRFNRGGRTKESATAGNGSTKVGIGTGNIEVLLAHPEFIPEVDFAGRHLTLRRTDARGNRIKPRVEYLSTVPHTENGESAVHEDLAYQNLANMLNNAMNKYVPSDPRGDISLTDEDMNNLPELDEDEKESLTPDEQRALQIKKARQAKREQRMGDSWTQSFNPQVSVFRDSTNLINGNRYAVMVDRIRAAVISAALNGGKVSGDDVPENSGYAISEFSKKMDAITKTINSKYADTPERIAAATKLRVDQVKEILATRGTAFGIPNPDATMASDDPGYAKAKEAYEYASSLIPWLYYLVSDYSGNTAADSIANAVMDTHANNDAGDAGSGISASGLSGTSMYNFGAGATMLHNLSTDPNVRELAAKFMDALPNLYPRIARSGDGLTVSGNNGDGLPVTENDMIGFLTLNISTPQVKDVLDRMKSESPDKSAIYDTAVNNIVATKRGLVQAIGKGGPSNTLIKDIGKDFITAIKSQLDSGNLSEKSPYVINLKSVIDSIDAAKGNFGLRNLAETMGYSKNGNQIRAVRNTALIGKIINDQDIVRGLSDISTLDSAPADDGADAADRDAGQATSTEFIDSATTAARYVDTASTRDALNMPAASGDDAEDDGAAEVQGGAVTTANYEIPFTSVGAKLGAKVAPERLIPLFATEVIPLTGSSDDFTKVYLDLVPRITHYIINHSHGTVDLGHSGIYDTQAINDVMSVASEDLASDVRAYFKALSADAREAITNRTNWVKLLDTIDESVPMINSMVRMSVASSSNGEIRYETVSDKMLSSILDHVLKHIRSAIFHVKRNSRNITFKDTTVVKDGTIPMVNVYNGVNRETDGRILRKSGNGKDAITFYGNDAAKKSGATVTAENREFFDVTFTDDQKVSIASSAQAKEYIKPSMVMLSTKGATYYSVWNGIVTYSDFSTGVAENTLHTDDRLKQYHASELARYRSERASSDVAAAEAGYEQYEHGVSDLCSATGAEPGLVEAFIPALASAVGNDISSVRKTVIAILNSAGMAWMTVGKREKPEIAERKAPIRAQLSPVYNLKGMFNGDLEREIRGLAETDPAATKICQYFDSLTKIPAYAVISGIVGDQDIGAVASQISGKQIPQVFNLVSLYSTASAYRKQGENGLNITGDPSLYEKPAASGMRVVEPLQSDEDEYEEIVNARMGMHDGINAGGELTMYADEHDIDSVSMDSGNYAEVFSDAYPMIGLIKTGTGMASHGELLDGDSICGTGLNTYDMKVLLGALDSAHEEVAEVKMAHGNGRSGAEMALLTGTYLVSYLIDTFYDMFTMSGTGRMNHENGMVGRVGLINQSIDRFKTIATRDSIDPTMYSYIIKCVEALDSTSFNDGKLPDVLTGLANIVVYLESINPANTAQTVNNPNYDLTREDAPAGSSPYAKAIASTQGNPRAVTGDISAVRNAFKNQSMEIYGADTRFGKTVAEMYHMLDRGKTAGFRNQYDAFDDMVKRLREKAVGSDVVIHGNIANSDLMSEILSAIIDDEGSVSGDGSTAYPKVADLLKKLHDGTNISSLYLLNAEPKFKDPENPGRVDVADTVPVRFGANGEAIMDSNSNAPGARFETLGDVVKAANTMVKESNLKITKSAISVANADAEILNEDGTVNDAVVTDLVRGVRSAVTDNLIAGLSVNNKMPPRFENLFHVGAENIKTGNGTNFVSIALILMLLYTRSIDKARYAQVDDVSRRMVSRMHAGQMASAARRVAEIDPSLQKMMAAVGDDADTAVGKSVGMLVRYGNAILDGNDAEANDIAESDEAKDMFGSDAAGFMRAFGSKLHQHRVDSVTDPDVRESRVRTSAEMYMAKALRTNPGIASALNKNNNVNTMTSLSGLLAQYRGLTEPGQTTLPEYKAPESDGSVSDDENERRKLRTQIRDMMRTAALGDSVLGGYLKVAQFEDNPTKLMNLANNYVGQLMATDPVFRENVMADRNDRDDIVTMQGVTPLSDAARSGSEAHATEVEKYLANGSARSEQDSKQLNALGLSSNGYGMVDGVITECDRIIDHNLVDSMEQYTAKSKLLQSNPNLPALRAENARTAIAAHNPDDGTKFTGSMAKLRDIIAAIADSGSDQYYAGVSASSRDYNELEQYVSSIPDKLKQAFAAPDAKTRKEQISEMKSRLHQLIANVYAHGTKIYRDGLTKKMANLAQNTTLVKQKMMPADCIKLLTAVSKVDHNISVHATAPGSSEEVYQIYGTPRTEDEAVAIVNAAVSDYMKRGNDMPDVDELLYNTRAPGNADTLAEIGKYIKMHYSMTTGADVTAEAVAPYVMSVLTRSHCVSRGKDGFIRKINVNGDVYQCTIPVSYIIEVVSNHMPNDMDSDAWAAMVQEFDTYKVSSVHQMVTERTDSDLGKLVALTEKVRKTLDASCTTVANNAIQAHQDEYSGAHGINVKNLGGGAVTDDRTVMLT